MKRKCLLILLLALVSSCATIINKKNYNIAVSSTAKDALVTINDSTYVLPAKVNVRRSPEDLALELKTDSITKNYIVKAELSSETLYGNLFFSSFYPVGFFIDMSNDKRYTYGRKIVLDPNDSLVITSSRIRKKEKLAVLPKNTINLTLSIPYINSFYLRPEIVSPRRNTGFFGFSAGLEYYYKDNRYYKLNISGMTDFFLPIPAAVDTEGEQESMTSVNVSLTRNYRIRRFTIGYGMHYSANRWVLTNDEFSRTSGLISAKSKDYTIGPAITAYYQLGKSFHTGVNYYASVYSLYPDAKFKYQHIISIDLLWKIRLFKSTKSY